jgi:hypothetical protein
MKKRIVVAGFVILSITLIAVLIWFFGFHLPKVEKDKNQQQLVKEYYDNKLNLYQQENDKYSDYEVDVVFLGDSLTDGYNLKLYYPDYVVSNRGIGGETTHGLEERLKVSAYDLKPKVVVMLIGGNNLNTMFENYEDILIGLKDNLPNTKVILLSLTAMGKDWGHKNEIACLNNVKIKLLAEKYDYTFVDLFTPLFDINIGEVYSDYTTDGAHFTSKGYEVVTSVVKPVIDSLLVLN